MDYTSIWRWWKNEHFIAVSPKQSSVNENGLINVLGKHVCAFSRYEWMPGLAHHLTCEMPRPNHGTGENSKKKKKMYIYTHIEVVSPFWPEAHPRVPFHVIYGKNGDFLSPFYCSGGIFVFEYYQYSLHILSLSLFTPFQTVRIFYRPGNCIINIWENHIITR